MTSQGCGDDAEGRYDDDKGRCDNGDGRYDDEWGRYGNVDGRPDDDDVSWGACTSGCADGWGWGRSSGDVHGGGSCGQDVAARGGDVVLLLEDMGASVAMTLVVSAAKFERRGVERGGDAGVVVDDDGDGAPDVVVIGGDVLEAGPA